MTNEEMENAEPVEIFEEYVNQKSSFHFEGDSGLEHLNEMAKDLGYKENGFRYGSSLEQFLSDNSGAQAAIIDWIRENMDKNWAESLSNELELEDEVEDDVEVENV